jgi:hypothetical protein
MANFVTRSAILVSVLSLAALHPLDAQTAAQRQATLLDPSKPFWSTRAPATVTADVETTRGTITIELRRGPELISALAPVPVRQRRGTFLPVKG